ncbi:PH domain-containing protein, partial [Nocardioides sp.]|uniref:PH domain-containing protein n=1 Tax=Nocardioides sp. TaxID=35761 RepID=UPI0035192CAE
MSGPEVGTDWRRLDPRMLVVHPVRELARFVPALLVVLFAGRVARDGEGGAWQLLAVLGPLALGIVRYLSTRYLLTPDRIAVRHGLLRRRVIEVPRARVRTVDLTATLSQRLLGLVSMRVGTGLATSTDQDDLVLDGLGAAAASRLRDDLLESTAHDGAPLPRPDARPDAGPDAGPVSRFHPSWLRFAPLDTTALAAVAAALASGASLVLQSAPDLGRRLESSAGTALRDAAPLVGVALVVLVLGAVALVLVVGPVVRAALVDGGYRLDRTPRAWRVTRGLLTRQETTLDDARVAG